MVVVQGGLALLDVAEYSSDSYAPPVRKALLPGGAANGLSLCSATRGANTTTVTFSRPLKGAGGAASADVVPGASASVAWAYGTGSQLAFHGANAGKTTVVW